MKSWEDQIQPLIDEYKAGDTDPLDGDAVDDLALILKAKINKMEGNITEEDYDNLLDNKPIPPKLAVLVLGGLISEIASEIPLDVTLYDYDNIKAGGDVEKYPITPYTEERIKSLDKEVAEMKERA